MNGPVFVHAGYVDADGHLIDIEITRDSIPAAVERGWLVLDEALVGVTVSVSRHDATGYSSPENDDDEGA